MKNKNSGLYCIFCGDDTISSGGGIADVHGSAHYKCFREAREKGERMIADVNCCRAMAWKIGCEVTYEPFSNTLAVYKEDNEFKFYFNGMIFCPWCGQQLLPKPELLGDKDDISSYRFF